MGRKNVRTDDPVERIDTKILEVEIELAQTEGLRPGLRVTGYIARPAGDYALGAVAAKETGALIGRCKPAALGAARRNSGELRQPAGVTSLQARWAWALRDVTQGGCGSLPALLRYKPVGVGALRRNPGELR
jgi:hypothetical protein